MSRQRFLSIVAVGSLTALAATVARADVRDAAAKVRGDHGDATQWDIAPRYTYRSAPIVVRSAPAASVTAQAPAGERRFSYAPTAPQAPHVQGAPQANVQVAPGIQSLRTYSYEPAAPERYYVPRRRGSGPPTYLLPKTDPRKYDAR